MNRFQVARVAILVSALAVGLPTVVAAQGPQPVDQPPEFATVRAKFENLTLEQVRAAGYVPEPVCISDPAMGGMGVHAINATLFGAQFPTAEPDPQNPPLVLLSGDMSRVVGLEWEAKDIGQGDMELFSHEFPLLPGHPGIPEPHYMFHAYFRPNGQVLFSVFDPELACLTPSTAMAPPEGNGPPGWTPLVLGVLAMGAGLVGLSRAVRREG